MAPKVNSAKGERAGARTRTQQRDSDLASPNGEDDVATDLSRGRSLTWSGQAVGRDGRDERSQAQGIMPQPFIGELMITTLEPQRLLGRLAFLCVSLLIGAATLSSNAAELQPIADYFRNSTVSSAAASPSGRYVALSATDGTHDRLRLMVVDLQDTSKSQVLFASDEEDVLSPQWVNENRLVFYLGDRTKAIGEKAQFGLMSIDREAKDGTRLLIRSNDAAFSRAEIVKSGLVLPPWYFLETTSERRLGRRHRRREFREPRPGQRRLCRTASTQHANRANREIDK